MGVSRVSAEGRQLSRKVDYPSGRLIILPETLNGLSGASNGRFGPCFGRKTAVRATFRPSRAHDRPEIGHLGDHSTFRETNDASKSIRDLPERIIDLPGKVSMVSGSINEVPQRIKQVARRIREVPGRLTMACGSFNGLPGDQRWCRDGNDGCRHAAGHAVGGVSGWWLSVTWRGGRPLRRVPGGHATSSTLASHEMQCVSCCNSHSS